MVEFIKSDFQEIYVTYKRVEASFLKSLLDQAGIRYYCLGEYRVPIRFFVHKDDAAEIFEDFEKSTNTPADPSTEPPSEPDQTD